MREGLVAAIPNLRAFAISLSGDHHRANDLVQETLLKAWSNRDSFEAGTNLKAWLFTILRNTYYSSLRRHRREVADPDGIHAQSLFVKPDHHGRLVYGDFYGRRRLCQSFSAFVNQVQFLIDHLPN